MVAAGCADGGFALPLGPMSNDMLISYIMMPLSGVVQMTVLDVFAVAWLIFLVAGMSWYIDTGPHAAESASGLMRARRMGWMQEMSLREVRIVDSSPGRSACSAIAP